MTQEERMLLIKDLSARLPYAVTVEHTSGFRGTLHDMTVHHMYDDNDNVYDAICYTDFFGDEDSIYIEYFKPYLFPLSSITEEQSMELFKLFGINLVDSIGADYIKINECTGITFFLNKGFDVETHLDKLIDWLNKNHFDYRGLIERGLANDATGLNIY